jgi:MFS family permease
MSSITASFPTTSRRRKVAFAVLTAVPALLILAFSGQHLITGWFSTADGGAYRFQELSWGVAKGIVLFVGLAVSLYRPERRPAAYQQVLAGGLALLATMALTAAVDPAVLVIVGLLAIAGWLHPARHRLLEASWHTPTLALSALVAVPLTWYALAQASLHRAGAPGDPAIELLRYVGTALAALAILATLIVAAARVPGYRTAAYSATAGLAVLGSSSLLFPEATSAFTAPWAWLALATAAAIPIVGCHTTEQLPRHPRE